MEHSSRRHEGLEMEQTPADLEHVRAELDRLCTLRWNTEFTPGEASQYEALTGYERQLLAARRLAD
jgi:hypothetical protein